MPTTVFRPFSETIKVSSDDRGVFVPFIQDTNNRPDSNLPIKRAYYVYNYAKGIIRGFHFHKKEWKYFIVANGAAKIVALDPDKPEEKFSFVSSSRKGDLVVIPPGFANGWISLEDNTILICCSTASLEESIKDDIRYDPHKWGDVWKVKGR